MGNPTRIVSVTGLGDWLTVGRRADLRRLNGAAGRIAFMFYHRGRDVEPAETYIDARFLREILGPYAVDELFPELSLEDCDGSSH